MKNITAVEARKTYPRRTGKSRTVGWPGEVLVGCPSPCRASPNASIHADNRSIYTQSQEAT
jgi:hypothetical protein